MSIISKETFDKFTEEEKEDIRHLYNGLETMQDRHIEGVMNSLFGKENLQPKIRTWEDCQEMNEDSNFFMRIDDNLELSDKVYFKCIATLQIAKLIELGYGGMITDEEWKNVNIKKYSILYRPYTKELFIKDIWNEKCFISFHHKQQAEEFMSYPENIELIKQYFMI